MSRSMRERYARGICSQFFIETGRPKIMNQQLEIARKDIKTLKKELKEATKEAEHEAEEAYKEKHRDARPGRIVFA